MKFSNYHTHSQFCDGAGNPEEYVQQAIRKNMFSLGFSGHATVPFKSDWNMNPQKFEEYISEIRCLKEKYSAQIPLYLGAEIDFINEIQSISDFRKYDLDFIIGAVHYLKPENTDEIWDFIISPKIFDEGLEKYFENDIRKLIKFYYTQMNLMLENGGFEIVAHIDQIGKFNKGQKYFSENDKFYKDSYHETISLCAEKNIIVELNTRGRLKNLTENFYPNFEFIRECRKKNVRITLSADAHRPEEVDSFMVEAVELVKIAGYKEIFAIENGIFLPMEI
jgi:histidinol-phosphatase (PHP family)